MDTIKKNDFESVAQMAARLTGDPTIAEGMKRHARATAIVNALEEIRIRKGLKQKDVAERMKVSESTVSRFEDSRDEDLRVGDLVKYADAVGMKLTLFMEDPKRPAAEQIKHCVFKISELLQQLTALAKECHDDKAIFDGIVRFRGEVLFNFLSQYQRSEFRETVFTNMAQTKTPRKPRAGETVPA